MLRSMTAAWWSRPGAALPIARVYMAIVVGTLVMLGQPSPGSGSSPAPTGSMAGERLLAAYPEHLVAIEAGHLVWRDGTRMPLDDRQGDKPLAAWLAAPDIEDMFRFPYPAGAPATAPPPGHDPGRARNQALFDKMYGDCRRGEVEPRLVEVLWLGARGGGQRLRVTTINGVADRLRAVSAELERLPATFDVYLKPSAGTYNCRPIAGTTRISAHGHGIAIDIALTRADYWQWAPATARTGAANGAIAFQNRIHPAIVAIFEAHGFIWGGRWYHYDTMHFEYRPELLPPRPSGAPPSAVPP
jgi:D-alanyl-D-alanine carboxypeptidase